MTPALLIRVSRRPNSDTVRCTASFGLLLAGDVGLEHERGTAVAADAARQVVEAVLAPGHQRHGRTLGGQRDRGGRADAARGPGDKGDGAGQFGGHRAQGHSTVTLLARLRGWSMSTSRRSAAWYASSCSGTLRTIGSSSGSSFGTRITSSVRS